MHKVKKLLEKNLVLHLLDYLVTSVYVARIRFPLPELVVLIVFSDHSQRGDEYRKAPK